MTPSLRLAQKNRLLILFAIFALCLFALGLRAMHKAPLDPAIIAADPNVHQVVAADTDFGFRLLKQLNQETPDKNVFFSPFSVSDALTMALNGAGRATETEMASTLGLKAMTQDQINHANGLLLPSLENPDPQVELSVANALWANAGTNFDADFQKRCRTFYDARTETLDFSSPNTADTINGWVKDTTNGKIDQLVSAGDLTGSAAVLTNAVYYHGQWSHEFEKSATQDGPFTLANGSTRTIPLMSQAGSFPYLETSQFQAISLPYGEGRMSLDVFLPKPGKGINDLVNGMTAKLWEGRIGKMQSSEVTIILPRFRADYQATLNTPLTALGMGSAFAPGADFSPMGLRGSVISKVVHKAIIEVDEEGTVAAAATGTVMPASTEAPPQIGMRVDHPFFIAIRDNTTGPLLFAGVIRDPN